jgi:cyanophycin synthetase
MNLIELDAQADALLGLRGYTRDSVPAQGELVVLRGTANISTGGTAIDVTDSVHPDNRAMLERAARLVGLDVAGIDFITPDIARSYREAGGAICEVNSSPGLRPHQIAAQAPGAPPRDVIGPIIELMFPGGGNGRIPIAAITGTNGKTTTSRMLAHILRHAGGELGVRVVGLATTHGVTINDETVAQGDFAGAPGARILLGDPAVEAAVLETARGGILENGVGFDWCDVGAVLNVAADHLGLRGVASLDDLAAAKSCVATAARRLVVLNADDPRCLAMAAPKPPEQVCLFTLEPLDGRLRDAIGRGSLVIGLAERDGRETIHAYRRDGSEDLIATAAMPATLGGAARHNVQNAMAAAGLALGLGLSPGGIAAALAAFRGDHTDNPGRLNLIEGFPFTILHDAAHNPHGMRMACAALRALPASGRRICVITGVGYRHGEHIEAIAEIIAGEFDVFLCSRLEQIRRPNLVKRDFPLEEVPARLAAALATQGVDPDRVQTIDLDKDAVDRGLQMARAGDLLVLFTGLVAWTRERVLQFGATAPG